MTSYLGPCLLNYDITRTVYFVVTANVDGKLLRVPLMIGLNQCHYQLLLSCTRTELFYWLWSKIIESIKYMYQMLSLSTSNTYLVTSKESPFRIN